mmetsp:Transcript_8407/g.14149  ORF Transcript_8407/g.14149 Transcript_8407/m.14149 type:complete len:316 (-) Transcript_8407:166-1113(-)
MSFTENAAKVLLCGRDVIDAHVHITCHSRVAYQTVLNDFLLGAAHDRPAGMERLDFTEADLQEAVRTSGLKLVFHGAVYVEALPTDASAVDDACFILDLIASPSSTIKALVARAPVTQGVAALCTWIDMLRTRCGGALPSVLRGVRDVMMLAPEGTLTSPDFLEAISVLGEHELHFEFALNAHMIPQAAAVARACPGTRFVLNHCGLNASGQDFERWKADLTSLAACSNVIACKLSAIEEWQPLDGDPLPYLEHALRTFGPARCMYASNWFVPLAFGQRYGETARRVAEALTRVATTDAHVADVFHGTARRVYAV